MSDRITEEQLQLVAEQAADKAAKEVCRQLGIDADNPIEMQRDMQYLNQQRKAAERITVAVRVSLILTAASGLISMLWVGFKNALSN